MAVRQSFFAELKRRNVLRAAVLLAGVVWALSQGISQLAPALGLPDVATRWFLTAALIAFPFWIAFAWFYGFTPQGIKREHEIAPEGYRSWRPAVWRRLMAAGETDARSQNPTLLMRSEDMLRGGHGF